MILFAVNLPIDTLRYLQTINDNIDAIKRIVDVSNATIANEIGATNTLLVTFTIVTGVIGIILGVYLSSLQRKVSRMKKEIEDKEAHIIKLAKKVEYTDNKIQSDIHGLYKQLREEETMTLLERLKEEPQDIDNLSELLLARSIGDEGYPILKSAYLKLLEIGKDSINFDEESKTYMILFFQHFMSQSLLDNDIREDLRKNFNNVCVCAFKQDIINSTKEMCTVLSRSGVPFEKEPVLIDYLKAINNSQFKNLVELKNIFQEEIKNKMLLVNAIEKCASDKIYLEMFDVKKPSIS
ncbi:MAG: hypothetical protein K6F40_03515 [Bacteroidales bacterium]|nr:hypothetical protein [Bacteroidales bacterium]